MRKSESFLQPLCSELTVEKINKIARETGFMKRSPKKIEAQDFLSYLCQESIKGTVSYNDLASKLNIENKSNASRQAYYYRTNKETVEFFKRILEYIMKSKYDVEEYRFNKKNTREY